MKATKRLTSSKEETNEVAWRKASYFKTRYEDPLKAQRVMRILRKAGRVRADPFFPQDYKHHDGLLLGVLVLNPSVIKASM